MKYRFHLVVGILVTASLMWVAPQSLLRKCPPTPKAISAPVSTSQPVATPALNVTLNPTPALAPDPTETSTPFPTPTPDPRIVAQGRIIYIIEQEQIVVAYPDGSIQIQLTGAQLAATVRLGLLPGVRSPSNPALTYK